jgi:hypothetical protein
LVDREHDFAQTLVITHATEFANENFELLILGQS